MRTTRWTARFKKDFRREMHGIYGRSLKDDLNAVMSFLEADIPLPPRHRDHSLGGDLQDVRDCHVRPDLVLFYRRPDEETLELVRLGSHSELRI